MKKTLVKRMYTVLLILEFLIVIFTPTLIKDGISFLKEEYVEGIIIFCVFIIWYFTYKGYEKQINNKETLLEENFKYIGSINVQVDQSARILAEIEEYPKNHKDLIDLSYKIGEDTLKIFKLKWLIIKIIDATNTKTIEKYFIQGKEKIEKIEEMKISNTSLLEGEKIPNIKIITSEIKNSNIKTFFLMPKDEKIDSSNINLIKSILMKIEMLSIIYLKK